MKKLLLVLALLAGTTAHAQTSVRVADSVGIKKQRYILKLLGSGGATVACADNAGGPSTDCTITASGGGGGGVTSFTASTGISSTGSTGAITVSVDQTFSPTWSGTHAFSLPPSLAGFTMPDGSAASVSSAAHAKVEYNDTYKALTVSTNGGAYYPVLTSTWTSAAVDIAIIAPARGTGSVGRTVDVWAGTGDPGFRGGQGAYLGGMGGTGASGGDGIFDSGIAGAASTGGSVLLGASFAASVLIGGANKGIYFPKDATVRMYDGQAGALSSGAGFAYRWNASNNFFEGSALGAAYIPFVQTTVTQTLSGKTYSNPIFSGSSTGTWTIGGLPTITATGAVTWSTSSGLLTVQGAGGLTLSAPSSTINMGVTSAVAINIGNAASPSTTTFAGTLAFPAGGIATAALASNSITFAGPSFLSGFATVALGGTLTLSLASTSQRFVLIGPTSGSGAPTQRALVAGDLPNTAVTPGSCTACSLTIDQHGNITAQSSGAGGGSITSITWNGGLTATQNPTTTTSTASLDLTYAANWTGAGTYTKTSIGATVANAPFLTLTNTTAAAVNAQQWSPGLVFHGNVWNTTATAATNTQDMMLLLRPVQGTSAALGSELVLWWSNNGGAYVEQLKYTTITQSFVVPSGATLNLGPSAVLMGQRADGVLSGINVSIQSSFAYSTAGTTILTVQDNSTTGRLRFGVSSGLAGVHGNGEDVTCTGTCTASEAMCWTTTADTVQQCGTTDQAAFAGIAAATVTNATINLIEYGRAQVKCETGTTAKALAAVSASTAGRIETPGTPTVGQVIGKVTKTAASNLCTVFINQ